MTSPWLLFDVSYLCHRAFHSTGGLSHEGHATGVVFGFLKSVESLQTLFCTERVVFCFDSDTSLRKKAFPDYKANRLRIQPDPILAVQRREMRGQIRLLRDKYIGQCGWSNVFWQDGYEADDIIASLVKTLDGDMMIVSADRDLYQLLRPSVKMYDPVRRRAINVGSFNAEYGVMPRDWPTVKSLAGCDSDNIAGIRGVGEKTACRWIAGKKITALAKSAIERFRPTRQFSLNLELVSLPYPGVNEFEPVEGEVDVRGWNGVMDQLGIKSLRKAAV